MDSKAVRITCQGADALDILMLNDFQGNLKDLSKENYEKLKKEILELGFSEPVSVWKQIIGVQDGDAEGMSFQYNLLNGHQRVRTLRQMRSEGFDIPLIPVNYIEAESVQEAKKKILALTSQYGEITKQGLYEFMTESGLSFESVSDSFRFPEIDLESFKLEFFEDNKVDPGCDEDEVPEHVEPKTKPGDIYQLGNHRLLCGDSTNIQHVELLMSGEKADMVFTDPPYGISYKSNYNSRDGSDNVHSALINDDNVKELLNCLPLFLVGPAFICTRWDVAHDWVQQLERLGLKVKNQIVWVKSNHSMGDLTGAYGSKWEAILFAHDGSFEFPNSRPNDVWELGQIFTGGYRHHPTEKTVKVPEKAIEDTTNTSAKILDLFGGSGSTLIACEKTNRKCFMMELDPHYCDVIVARWEKFSSKKAILLNNPDAERELNLNETR